MIAIIPAGGQASRINGIPKMLLPTPNGTLINRLYKHILTCHVRDVAIMTKGVNATLLRSLGYIVHSNEDRNMSHAVMLAKQHALTEENILFGMPDTYIEDGDCFNKLATAINGDCDVAVAIFRARPDQHKQGGMVHTKYGKVMEVVDKPATTDMVWIWGALAWKPAFWQHLSEFDPHVGYALPRAIAAGLDIRAIRMDGGFWDCGTAQSYFELIHHLTGEKVAE